MSKRENAHRHDIISSYREHGIYALACTCAEQADTYDKSPMEVAKMWASKPRIFRYRRPLTIALLQLAHIPELWDQENT